MQLRVFTILRILVIAGACFAAGSLGLIEGDTYWHLATGRWVLEHGTVPKADPFSWTAFGREWHAHEWLWDVLAYEAHSLAGTWGVWFLVSLGFALFGWAAFRLSRGSGLSGFLAASTAVLASVPFFFARPHSLAWGLLGLWLVLLDAPPRVIWKNAAAGLFLGALWANVHGSAPLAPGLALMAFLFKKDRSYLVASIASALGVCLNPWGPGLYVFTVEFMREPLMAMYIGEWGSPNFHHAFLLVPFLTFAMWLFFVFRETDAFRKVLTLLFFCAALRSVRFLPLFYLAAAAACGSASLLGGPGARKAGVRAAAFLVSATICLGLLSFPPSWESREGPFPEKAVSFMLESGLTERVANWYQWGGYLIYRGVRPFVDGRADMYILSGTTVFQDYLRFAVLRGQSNVPALDPVGVAEKWGVYTVLVPPGSLPDLVLREHGWEEMYRDDVAVVLVKDGE